MNNDDVLIRLFEDCYSEALEERRRQIAIKDPFPPFLDVTDPWPLFTRVYKGDLYSTQVNMATWRSRPSNNKCFQTVEANTTYLTDNRPKGTVLPRDAGDFAVAELTRKGIEYWWDKENMDLKTKDVVKLSRMLGLGWRHLDEDHHCTVVHPEAILVDPDCTADNYDPTYLIYRYKTTVGELRKAYPKADWDSFVPDYRPPADTGFASVRPQERKSALDTFLGGQNVVHPARTVWCYQFWLKDSTAEQVEKEVGELVVVVEKPKYKNGRVMTIAGNILLEDRASQFDHGEFPFIPTFAYTVPDEFYAKGDVEIILSSVVYRNKVTQIYLDSLTKSTGAIYLRNPRYMKSPITNDPIQEHEVTDVDKAMKVVNTGSLRRHETDLINIFDKDADDGSGLHEYSKGVPLPGNKTAQEVSIIAESDKTRIRAAARQIAWSNKMLLRQLLSNIAQFRDFEWIVRVNDESGEEVPIVYSGGQLEDPITKDIVEFDLVLDDYSMLPASQRDRTDMWLLLKNLYGEALPDEDFLDGIGVPNAKEMAAKIERAKAALMPEPEALPEGPPEEGDLAALEMGMPPMEVL